jgi:hypothetical protein
MARRARRWRVRNALTRAVNVNEAGKVSAHVESLMGESGRLPF